jgi:hypothetical protein
MSVVLDLGPSFQSIAEVHQSAAPMSQFQVVIPQTPEAEKMVLMMNKNFHLSFFTKLGLLFLNSLTAMVTFISATPFFLASEKNYFLRQFLSPQPAKGNAV